MGSKRFASPVFGPPRVRYPFSSVPLRGRSCGEPLGVSISNSLAGLFHPQDLFRAVRRP